MPAERTFLVRERVILNNTLVHGVGDRIPWSRAVELGLTTDRVDETPVPRSVANSNRMRRVPDRMKRTTATGIKPHTEDREDG